MPDRVPQLTLTNQIRQAVERTLRCKCLSNDLRDRCTDILRQNKDDAVIPTTLVKELYNTLRDEGHKIFLHEIVEDALLILQSVSLPPRNPELEARIRKLQVEQENKEYKRMTRNVHPGSKQTFSFQEEVKSMNRQIVAIINFVLTVLAGFAFGYKVVEYSVGKVFPMQMMSGLVVGTVVFFVDLYFLMRYGL